MIFISDINDRRISEFKEMKRLTINNYYKNEFIADSKKVVTKALHSDLKFIKILSHRSYIEENYNLLINRLSNDNILIADKKVLNNIVGFELHSGVMALIEMPLPTDINFLDNNIVGFNRIDKAENIGAIIRSGVGFGFYSFLLDNQSCHPYKRKSVRISMGAVFKSKYRITNNLMEDLEYLKFNGYSIIVCELDDRAINLNSYNFNTKSIIIFGSETRGIDQTILSLADDIIKIPITKDIDSLNVNATASIIFNYIYNNYEKQLDR